MGKNLREEMKRRGDLLLLAPVVKGRKGFHTDVAEWAAKHGYKEIRADGKIYPTGERLRLDRFQSTCRNCRRCARSETERGCPQSQRVRKQGALRFGKSGAAAAEDMPRSARTH